jgi:nucleotide-binding universal stress UspA family protein
MSGGAVMERILVATDGTAVTAEAMAFAVDLAAETSAELHVVAVRPLGGGTRLVAREIDTPSGAGRIADAACGDARGRGLRAIAHVAQGDPAEQIAAAVAQVSPDMVVLGAHPYDAVHRAYLGSVSRGVVGRSAAPVTIVAQARGQ